MTPPDQMNSSFGSMMFPQGQQGQPPSQSQQPNQEGMEEEKNEDATGMAKAVASARDSLLQLSRNYPEFSQIADKAIQALVDQMYQQMTQQGSQSSGQEGMQGEY